MSRVTFVMCYFCCVSLLLCVTFVMCHLIFNLSKCCVACCKNTVLAGARLSEYLVKNPDTIMLQNYTPKHQLLLSQHETTITLKTSKTIAIFQKKTQNIFIPNCISTINLWLSLVLILTCASLFTIMLNDSVLLCL